MYFWLVNFPVHRFLELEQSLAAREELDCAKLFNTSTAIGALYAGAFAAEASKPLTRTDPWQRTQLVMILDGVYEANRA